MTRKEKYAAGYDDAYLFDDSDPVIPTTWCSYCRASKRVRCRNMNKITNVRGPFVFVRTHKTRIKQAFINAVHGVKY